MGDIKGFLKVKRRAGFYRPVCERLKDYSEVAVLPKPRHSQEQASRCMDCGTPFCHWSCPIGNYIPEWNDLIFNGHWEKAIVLLEAANNLPEVTGRICPALCEYSCVLGINDEAVAIRENELSIIEQGFRRGYIKAHPPKRRTGKKIAVVGSGPAGLSCAAQLNQAGHSVTVFEKDAKAGGIMRYGIPDFKLDKQVLDRRIKIWKKEGVVFKPGINIGVDLACEELLKEFDAVCLAAGSRLSRDLKIPGRELEGIYFAMDYLVQSNMMVEKHLAAGRRDCLDAKGKKVVVIGGGDTGADCVGVANRQGAACVVQIELMPQPFSCRSPQYPWPKYPVLLKTTSSHEEGSERKWSILTREFIGKSGKVAELLCANACFEKDPQGCQIIKDVPGSDFRIQADLVILALGFLHPEHAGPVKELGLELDNRGNVKAGGNFKTSRDKVFACGDMRRGQSLIVWAVSEGRRAARAIDEYLMGSSNLPAL